MRNFYMRFFSDVSFIKLISIKNKHMKKYLILTATFALTTLFSFAQEGNKFKIGFKINPNVSWLTPQENYMTSEGSAVRFGYGLTADIMFTDNYAFGTGVNIDDNGGKVSYFKTITTPLTDTSIVTTLMQTERNIKLKYLEIPLTLKMRTNEIGYFTYFFQFGLGLGFNLKAQADDINKALLTETLFFSGTDNEYPEWKDLGDDGETLTVDDVNIKDEIKPIRMGLIIGAGMEYNLSGNTSVIVGLNFNNGFTNIFRKDEKGIQTNAAGEAEFNEFGLNNPFDLKANGSSLGLTVGIIF